MAAAEKLERPKFPGANEAANIALKFLHVQLKPSSAERAPTQSALLAVLK
jgi:hypothetical protein